MCSDQVKLSSLIEARRKHASHRHPGHSVVGAEIPSRAALKQLTESTLAKAGFDRNKFDALIRQTDSETRGRAAQIIAEASSRSSPVLAKLHRDLVGLVDHTRKLRTLASPPGTEVYYLDAATEISDFGIAPPIHERIAPSPQLNSARFAYDISRGGEGFGWADEAEVSFGFLWQNPTGRDAVVNVDGFIALHGGCRVLTDGGFVVPGNFSNMWIAANLFIHELWNTPPTSPPDQPGQSEPAVDLELFRQGVILPGDIDGVDVAKTLGVEHTQFMMPPGGMAMFEVACTIFTWIHNGEAQADFIGSSNEVFCPGMLISVLP